MSSGADRPIVLVGTYRAENADWIVAKRLYNLPLPKGGKLAFHGRVGGIVLFAEGARPRAFRARFKEVADWAKLAATGYALAEPAKAHGAAYALYELTEATTPLKLLGRKTAEAYVCSSRCPVVRIDAAFYAKPYPKTGGRSMPFVFDSLRPYIEKGLTATTFDPVQMDFFDELIPVVAGALSTEGKKLRLATVFSGIGAIEQALLRTHVDHEIVFACDNGDQTPFVCGAVEWQECVDAFKKLSRDVDALMPVSESQRWAADMIRGQRDTIQALLNGAPAMSKRPDRELKDRVQMLYEALGFYQFRVTWEAEADWRKRKRLVDTLYRPLLPRNKVRQSYLANYPISEDRFHWNVTFLEGRPYRGKVDLFVGGSPCQSFSLVGKQMGLSDTRGTLFYEYARLVSEIRPKCFIYENVRALLSNDGGRTWKTMSKVFTDLGYDWKHQVLNAKDYGIPQNRERVFVVGFRKDLGVGDRFEFPKPKKLETTMQDFLLDVVPGKWTMKLKRMMTENEYACSYSANGIRVERDIVMESDLEEYFADCFHHHVGRSPSNKQTNVELFANGRDSVNGWRSLP